MNKRKKIIYYLLFFVVSFIYTNKVNAIYNGNAGTAFTLNGGYKGKCNPYQKNCLIEIRNGIALQARIYYIENGNFSQVGKTYYFVNKSFKNTIVDGNLNLIELNLSILNYKNYMEIISFIENDYLKNNHRIFLTKMLEKNYNEYLQKVNNNFTGYRLVIEPAYLYFNPTFGNGETHALMTKKGYVAEALRNGLNIKIKDNQNIDENNNSNENQFGNIGDNFTINDTVYVDELDVGIVPRNKRYCEEKINNLYTLADMGIGCGYHIIDITEYIKEAECYKSSVQVDKKLNCENYDLNNIGKYSEKYEKVSCKNLSNDENKQVTKYGTLMTSSGTCNLYCKETAMLSFPGNVGSLKQRGSYFAWPTRSNDLNGLYKMSMKTEFVCEIKDEVSETNVASVLYMRCPDGYTETTNSCRSKTDKKSKICSSSTIEINGNCYSITNATTSTTSTYSCSDGATLDTTKNKCITYVCPSGSSSSGGKCWKKGYTALGAYNPEACKLKDKNGEIVNVSICRQQDIKTESYCCAIPYSYVVDKVVQQSEPIVTTTTSVTCPSGYSQYLGDSSKCISITSSSKTCPTGYTEYNGECYRTKNKSKLNYFCPENYEMSKDKTTCTKNACDKDSLISSFKNNYLEKNNMSVNLSGGTNPKIDSKTLDVEYITNVDETNLKFTKIAYFTIPKNTNRYYNQLTDNVSNFYKKETFSNIFDRKEGVISLSKNDNIYKDGILKKYELIINNIKLGVDNKFGKLINSYKCYYKITDNPKCICPNGTKNGGVLIEELVEKIYVGTKTFNEKTCLDWQDSLCDSDHSYTNDFYCINTINGNKEKITDCVKTKKNVSLMDAIITCTEANNRCTNNYCYNKKSKSSVSIKMCLDEGNSRKSCMKKYGCVDSGKICSGNCELKETTINNVIYTLQVCEKNQYCNFEVQCKNNDTSKSSETCVKDKLGVNNIEDSLTNGTISLYRLKAAVSSCQKTICASDSKIIFRVIDLENPFPGKENSNKIGFSLNGSKSRNPGYNWNSKKIVKQEILNSRGKNGYELYSKTPLLKITLTPDTIRKIKNYNKQKKYDDFNLKCVGSNNTDCISSFLHTNTDIIKIEGVENCTKLNLSSTSNDFEKCYNSNN